MRSIFRTRFSGSNLSALLFAVAILLCSCSTKPSQHALAAERPMANSIRFEYAVYFLPKHGTTDPFAILRELLSKKYPKLKLVDAIPAKPEEMLVQARLERDVPHRYAPPDLESLQYSGKGLSREQTQALQKSREAFILEFAHPKEDVWAALRTANEVVGELATKAGGFVWDEETRNVFTPDSWHKKSLGGRGPRRYRYLQRDRHPHLPKRRICQGHLARDGKSWAA